jgi:hypothetical protein
MHARVEQLLSLRDGEPIEATVREHIAGCASCAAELTHLATTREHLRSLPMLDPPNELWGKISNRIAQGDSRRDPVRAVWVSVAAAAAIALFAIVLISYPPSNSTVALHAPAEAPQGKLSALVERSQQLEAELGALPQRPSVERVATAANIDGIELRIQWLDFHLSAANDVLDQTQTQQLWQERVNLMDSLVKLRDAEARVAQL